MYQFTLVVMILAGILAGGCSAADPVQQKPAELPQGYLADRIPDDADILFVSIRYVLSGSECLDDTFNTKKNFINDPACNKKIYDPASDALASPRQIYSLDRESSLSVQLTNLECDFSSIKSIDTTRIMAIGMCSDTNGDGKINTMDEPEIHILNLAKKEVECLTCDLDLRAINNPDYSLANQMILFSAQWSDSFHNYLFTLDLEKNLSQITFSADYMDFDCSWSEDGTKIVFSRLPAPFFSQPSQVWLMNADSGSQEKITDGGSNPENEESHGPYPIGIDADPDLSPDNSQIVFSRLRTGQLNQPFGIYELVVVDLITNEISILDSVFANMVPEWKEGGILFIRQIGSTENALDVKQGMYVYNNGLFENLEVDFDVFPIGSNGASWIE